MSFVPLNPMETSSGGGQSCGKQGRLLCQVGAKSKGLLKAELCFLPVVQTLLQDTWVSVFGVVFFWVSELCRVCAKPCIAPRYGPSTTFAAVVASVPKIGLLLCVRCVLDLLSRRAGDP